jgi:HK97 gp10 family phage protein
MIKVKIKDNSKKFSKNVINEIKKGMFMVGEDFERAVFEKTPIAPDKYANRGKLQLSIKSSRKVKNRNGVVSIDVSANAKDHNNRFYAFYVEFGSTTIPAHLMFKRTSDESDNFFKEHIIIPLGYINV